MRSSPTDGTVTGGQALVAIDSPFWQLEPRKILRWQCALGGECATGLSRPRRPGPGPAAAADGGRDRSTRQSAPRKITGTVTRTVRAAYYGGGGA